MPDVNGKRRPPRLFLSYAGDSPAHVEAVRQFWVFLLGQGVDARMDLPAAAHRRDWADWMLTEVRDADFVAVIASPEYKRRADGFAGPQTGRGVQFESRLIREYLYADYRAHTPVVLPVLLPGRSAADIPDWLGPTTTTHYRVEECTVHGAEALLRVLFDQPAVTAPAVAPAASHLPDPVTPMTGPPGRPLTLAVPGPARAPVGAPLAGSSAQQVARPAGTVPLSAAADGLADAMHRQWSAELLARMPHRTQPLNLRWSTTARPVTPPAAVVLDGSAVGGRPTALRLLGGLTDLVSTLLQLPRHQLVVLGEPGAGKTMLAISLTLGLLAHRRVHGGPVPVLLSLSSWNPRTRSLHRWLADRLVEDYPALANTGAYGPAAAERLVAEDRILPVLDGLDEMPTPLQAVAIDAICRAYAGRPVVLACRSAEYQDAVALSGHPLAAAAVVELHPVGVHQAIDYIRAGGLASDARWTPVFTHLRAARQSPLAGALSSPLMVGLACAIYASPRTDPAELLDRHRFADAADIEQHLLDALIPTVYPDPALDPAAAGRTYPPHRVTRWLAFLVAHSRRMETHDLAWWHIDRTLPRPVFGLLLGLLSGLASGLSFSLIAGPATGLVFGLVTGLGGGLVIGLMAGSGRPVPARQAGPAASRLRRLAGHLTTGAVFGTGAGLVVQLGGGPVTTLLCALGTGLAAGATGNAVGELGEWQPSTGEQLEHLSPQLSLRRSRVTATAQMSTAALGVGLGAGSSLALWSTPHNGLLLGVGLGLVGALVFGVDSASGRFVLARTWLAARGHLPLRLMRFLNDARNRGVLRQAGAVYQLRHARLRDHLMERQPAPAAPPEVIAPATSA